MSRDSRGPSDPASRSSRRGRRGTNIALLFLLPLAVFTGLYANTIGTDWPVHPATVHGIIAIAIAGLSPWKSAIIRRGLRRWTPTVWVSIGLLAMVLVALGTGFLHAGGYTGPIGPLSLMQAHIGAAIVAIVLVGWHFRAHSVAPRRGDLSRRAFLRSAGTAVVATAGWFGLEAAIDAGGLPGRQRRFTGSHERSSFDHEGLPVTSWLNDRVQQIDESTWRLRIDDVAMSLADVAAHPTEDVVAVLDCTSAWYSTQLWTGVRLDHLLEAGSSRSVLVTSATGYARRFPVTDLDKLWLVTHVGAQPLRAGHGFPARIVAPGRRGFWWVKWVTDIRTSEVPWWWQLPFPAT